MGTIQVTQIESPDGPPLIVRNDGTTVRAYRAGVRVAELYACEAMALGEMVATQAAAAIRAGWSPPADPNADERESYFLSLAPIGMPDYMMPAWVGCIRFALGDQGCVAQFRRDTGNEWAPSAMPDPARERAFLTAFVAWANTNVWGSTDAD